MQLFIASQSLLALSNVIEVAMGDVSPLSSSSSVSSLPILNSATPKEYTQNGKIEEDGTGSSDGKNALYKLWVLLEAPVTMAGLLLVEIALAIGHHFFYASLSGHTVLQCDDDNLGQQFNISVGTLFAFLVRVSLVGVIASAYAQHQWFDVQRNIRQYRSSIPGTPLFLV